MRFGKVYFVPLSISLGPCNCIYDNKAMKINFHMNNWSDFISHIYYITNQYPEQGIYINSVKLVLVLSIYLMNSLLIIFLKYYYLLHL